MLRCGVAPDEIDAIIVATITPDMLFPATACLIQDQLGLTETWGFDLSAACSGFLYGLTAGAQLVASGAHQKVVVVGADLMSSIIDPFDRTSPLIPIGPHWMLIWPFDAEATGLSTVMRDAGTMIMYAGTPYAHLHICGDPWEGNEYHPDSEAVWTMTYRRAR